MLHLKRLFLFSFIALSLGSCSKFGHVAFVPTYDKSVVDEIETGSKQNDALYDLILKSADKSYKSYDSLYKMQSATITSIVTKENARPKSFFLAGIANNLQSTFNRLRNIHKSKGVLNDTQLDLDKQTMQGQFKSLSNAEKQLK